MAGASMNDIKARMKSVRSTMQITKAMELVATSKLRRAKLNAENARPYMKTLSAAISGISRALLESMDSFRTEGARDATLFVVIAGDRGLAGGYNSNVFRLAAAKHEELGGEAIYLPLGKKALDYYRHREKEIYSDAFAYVSDVSVGDSLDLGKLIYDGFLRKEYRRVVLIYTRFISMLTQTPTAEELLPLVAKEDAESDFDPIVCGDPEELIKKIIPYYVGGIISSAVYEALASESGARRTSMSAANKNAQEMIDNLTLSFNRARQAVITQEITEIVSGAEAL